MPSIEPTIRSFVYFVCYLCISLMRKSSFECDWVAQYDDAVFPDNRRASQIFNGHLLPLKFEPRLLLICRFEASIRCTQSHMNLVFKSVEAIYQNNFEFVLWVSDFISRCGI